MVLLILCKFIRVSICEFFNLLLSNLKSSCAPPISSIYTSHKSCVSSNAPWSDLFDRSILNLLHNASNDAGEPGNFFLAITKESIILDFSRGLIPTNCNSKFRNFTSKFAL